MAMAQEERDRLIVLETNYLNIDDKLDEIHTDVKCIRGELPVIKRDIEEHKKSHSFFFVAIGAVCAIIGTIFLFWK